MPNQPNNGIPWQSCKHTNRSHNLIIQGIVAKLEVLLRKQENPIIKQYFTDYLYFTVKIFRHDMMCKTNMRVDFTRTSLNTKPAIQQRYRQEIMNSINLIPFQIFFSFQFVRGAKGNEQIGTSLRLYKNLHPHQEKLQHNNL